MQKNETKGKIMETNKFHEMNISEEVLRAIDKKGFVQATSVQAQTIQPMLNYQDVIAKAPTGTGKTFAFGIPIIEHIDPENPNPQALILAPTRELAIQITTELRALSMYKHGIGVLTIYGGQSIQQQIQGLKKRPKILIATPGRLKDHLNRRTIRLNHIKTLVLDEADRMVDMGFYQDVTQIIDQTKQRENLALFSATLSREVMTIGWKYQRDAVEVTVEEDFENKPDINQYRIKTTHRGKEESILEIMKKFDYKRVIVFCNTKRRVNHLTDSLRKKGMKVDCLHGDIRQNIREKVMTGFKKGKFELLIATDVAARGLDVEDVDTVFNYDIPDENQAYTHRIGRTGRAKKQGTAYTFTVNLADSIRIDEIAKNTQSKIKEMA